MSAVSGETSTSAGNKRSLTHLQLSPAGVFLLSLALPVFAQEFMPGPWECVFDNGTQVHTLWATQAEAEQACGDAKVSSPATDFEIFHVIEIVFTPPPPPPPSCDDIPLPAPTGLSLVDNVLSWEVVPGACEYRVRNKKDRGSPISVHSNSPTTELSMDLSDLEPGLDWAHMVSAINASGAASPEARLYAEIVAGGPTPIPIPEVVFNHTWKRATLNTDGSPFVDPLDQRLYYAQNNIPGLNVSFLTVPWDSEAVSQPLEPGFYCFRVTARNAQLNESDFSNQTCLAK